MEELPDELIENIIEYVEEMQSFFNLSLTCSRIAKITQDKLVQEKAKTRFGARELPTTSKCFETSNVKTFSKYVNRRVYKIPKYQFSLVAEELEVFEKAKFSLPKLIENVLLSEESPSQFNFVIWGYIGCHSPTELLWVIWRCLLEIKKRLNEKYRFALLRAFAFIRKWMQTNANLEWFSFPSSQLDEYKGYSLITSQESENYFKERELFSNERNDAEKIIVESGEEFFNLFNKDLFKIEFRRFLESIEDSKIKDGINNAYTRLSSRFQTLNPIYDLKIELNLEKRDDFAYNSKEIVKQLSEPNGIELMIQQLHCFIFFISKQIKASELVNLNYSRLKGFAPTIRKLTDFTIRFINSITNFILSFDNKSELVNASTLILKLADKLAFSSFPNYLASYLIFIVFSNAAIYRISIIHEDPVNAEILSKLSIFKSNQSFSEYRKHIFRNAVEFQYPPFGVYLTDITFASEGQPHTYAPPSYSFRYMKFVTNPIEKLISTINSSISQVVPTSDFQLLENLMQFYFLYDEPYSRSLQIHPRQQKSK